jgi:hypothetical protein
VARNYERPREVARFSTRVTVTLRVISVSVDLDKNELSSLVVDDVNNDDESKQGFHTDVFGCVRVHVVLKLRARMRDVLTCS